MLHSRQIEDTGISTFSTARLAIEDLWIGWPRPNAGQIPKPIHHVGTQLVEIKFGKRTVRALEVAQSARED
jgi:hypothetical protein